MDWRSKRVASAQGCLDLFLKLWPHMQSTYPVYIVHLRCPQSAESVVTPAGLAVLLDMSGACFAVARPANIFLLVFIVVNGVVWGRALERGRLAC